ncbi:MAG: type II secretion system protein J [Oligosphaeraceae bacterium]
MNKLHSHPFTLIEVLAAVAVLVIMMGFIFQFTSSAQKLWASNTGRTEMSAQADAVFSILQEDLEHLYVVGPEEDLDAQAGWYILHSDGSTSSLFSGMAARPLEDFCFFTQDIAPQSPATQAIIYPVRYHFVPGTGDIYGEGTGKLYRYTTGGVHWEKISEDFANAGNGDSPSWYAPEPASEDDKEEYLLAENIQSITIISDIARDEDGNVRPVTDNPLQVKPGFLRVTVTFSIPEHLRNGAKRTEASDMTFSRVFLLNK